MAPSNSVTDTETDENKEQHQDLEKKKRGRKPSETNKYYKDSEANIAKWTKELKGGFKLDEKTSQVIRDERGHSIKLTSGDKQKLRNRISALQSRMKKKEELVKLESSL